MTSISERAAAPRHPLCRSRMGTPLSMYPPGRVLFLRPIKTRVWKEWDAVWIEPEDIIGVPASWDMGCSFLRRRLLGLNCPTYCWMLQQSITELIPSCPSTRAAEGLLVSPHMLRDHLCSRAFEALVAAAERAENGGLQLSGEENAHSRGPSDGPPSRVTAGHLTHQERQRRQLEERRRQRAARRRWQQRFQSQQQVGSLQQVLIEAS